MLFHLVTFQLLLGAVDFLNVFLKGNNFDLATALKKVQLKLLMFLCIFTENGVWKSILPQVAVSNVPRETMPILNKIRNK